MEIVAYTTGDTKALLDIYAPYVLATTVTFEEEVPSLFAFRRRLSKISKKYPFFVAKEENLVVGYAYLGPYAERSAYRYTADVSIYVRDGFGHRGIGSALLSVLEADAKTKNFKALISVITEENQTSRRFHETRGFTLVGTLPGVGLKFGRILGISLYEKLL